MLYFSVWKNFGLQDVFPKRFTYKDSYMRKLNYSSVCATFSWCFDEKKTWVQSLSPQIVMRKSNLNTLKHSEPCALVSLALYYVKKAGQCLKCTQHRRQAWFQISSNNTFLVTFSLQLNNYIIFLLTPSSSLTWHLCSLATKSSHEPLRCITYSRPWSHLAQTAVLLISFYIKWVGYRLTPFS